MEALRGLCLAMVMFMVLTAGSEAHLKKNFYRKSCPNLESIVQKAIVTGQNAATIPGTLRLFLHDCFVMGCDASIMIAPNGNREQDAPDNLSLQPEGFNTVIRSKKAVEAACPGVVSCADILAIAARDVVVMAGGPSFEVELGRRDGFISQASMVADNLPQPSFNLGQLTAMFAKNNLSQSEMITLSGAHTVGFSHCNRFANRLYNFSSSSTVDPSLDPTYAKQLMQQCPPNATNFAAMDPVTPTTFDNAYYKDLMQGKGLFTSDEVLFTNAGPRRLVKNFARNPSHFNKFFAGAMKQLGRAGVKTGSQGEIRLDCTAFNS